MCVTMWWIVDNKAEGEVILAESEISYNLNPPSLGFYGGCDFDNHRP